MPIPVVRQRWSWWLCGAAALAIVGAVVLFRRHPVSLAEPETLPGLAELVAIATARVAHAAPIGAWMVRANDGVLVLAIALFLALARRCAVGWLAAIPAALAVALSDALSPALSPLQPAGIAIAAASYLALLRAETGHAIRDGMIACAALAGTALIEPRMAVALALLAGWVAARSAAASSTAVRWASAVGAMAIVLTAVVALVAVMPRLPPGLDATANPAWTSPAIARSWRDAPAAAWRVFMMAGPLAAALAVLGAFARRSDARARPMAPVLAYAIVSLLVAGSFGSAPSSDGRSLAPMLAGFWLLAAMGLDEFTRHASRSVRGGVVAVLVAILLPLWTLARPTAPMPGEFMPRGHERVALDDFKRLAAALPDGAVIVRADAVGDLLLRALDGTWQRMGKSLRVEQVEAPALAEAVAGGRTPVFALPAAQVRLPTLGFRLADAGIPGVSGLARVASAGGCSAATPSWQELPALAQTPSFALVSLDPQWEGPFVFYAESRRRLDAAPHQWPGTTDRGFGGRAYAFSTLADRALLDEAVRGDGFPAGQFSDGATDIVRLELWHSREAPRILVVDLSDRPTRVFVRVGSAAAPQTLTVCPVFPFEPRGF